MQVNQSRTNRTFEDIVEHDLLPAVGNFHTAHPLHKVIWLNQGPTLDLLGPITSTYNLEIHTEKIRKYNAITRRLLK